MPVHEYSCALCNATFDELKAWGDQVATTPCKCGAMATKVYSPPVVRPDITPHYSEQLGAYIGSRKDEKQAIAAAYEKSGGKVQMDWH